MDSKMHAGHRSPPNRLHKIDKEEDNKFIKRRIKSVNPKVNTGIPQDHHAGQSFNQPEVVTMPYSENPPEPKRNANKRSGTYGRIPTQAKYNGPYATLFQPPEKPSPYINVAAATHDNYRSSATSKRSQPPLNGAQANKSHIPRSNSRIPQSRKPAPSKDHNKVKVEDFDFRVDADKDENERGDSSAEEDIKLPPIVKPHKTREEQREVPREVPREIPREARREMPPEKPCEEKLSDDEFDEILSPRDLSDDCKSAHAGIELRKPVPLTPPTYLRSPASSEDEYRICASESNYFSASALQTSCDVSPSSSIMILNNFKELVQDKKTKISEEDIRLVRGVFKSDARHSLLKEKDPHLFKHLLKQKLEEVEAQERALKTALGHIDGSGQVSPKSVRINVPESTPKSILREPTKNFLSCGTAKLSGLFETEDEAGDRTPRLNEKYKSETTNVGVQAFASARSEAGIIKQDFEKKIKENFRHVRSKPQDQLTPRQMSMSNKPGVDITFTNVATMQEEVVLLHALGECLEATIKRTGTTPVLSEVSSVERKIGCVLSESSKSPTFTTNSYASPKRRIRLNYLRLTFAIPEVKAFSVPLMGICLEIGVAEEFRIEQKSLDELKSNAGSQFFIPEDPQFGGALKCTTFNNLKTNPKLLLSYIKGNDPKVSFNFLEQDPIFFQSFVLPELAKMKPKQFVKFREGDDHFAMASRALKNSKRVLSLTAGTSRNAKPGNQSNSIALSLKRGNKPVKKTQQRCSVRRFRTPMPMNKTLEPKNRLIKTVLVGIIQIFLFLVLVMAVTFPEIRC